MKKIKIIRRTTDRIIHFEEDGKRYISKLNEKLINGKKREVEMNDLLIKHFIDPEEIINFENEKIKNIFEEDLKLNKKYKLKNCLLIKLKNENEEEINITYHYEDGIISLNLGFKFKDIKIKIEIKELSDEEVKLITNKINSIKELRLHLLFKKNTQ